MNASGFFLLCFFKTQMWIVMKLRHIIELVFMTNDAKEINEISYRFDLNR